LNWPEAAISNQSQQLAADKKGKAVLFSEN
jgi:hypothetical protein